MKCAAVKLSDLGSANRLDATYHIARIEHRQMVDKLMALDDATIARLMEIAPAQQEALKKVLRGYVVVSKASLGRHTKEERCVYLAMVLRDLSALDAEADELERKAADVRARRDEIRKLTQ
jgi:hypothetical protein